MNLELEDVGLSSKYLFGLVIKQLMDALLFIEQY